MLRGTIVGLLLALLPAPTLAASFAACSSNQQISVVCPQTITGDTTNYWTAPNSFAQAITLADGTELTSTSTFGGGASTGTPGVTTVRTLTDTSDLLSLDWENRLLKDSAGTALVSWAGPGEVGMTADVSILGGHALALYNGGGGHGRLTFGGGSTFDFNYPIDGAAGVIITGLIGGGGGKSFWNQTGTSLFQDDVRMNSALSVGGGANIVYYCSGSTAGTFDGNLARGNSNAGACAGGTWVATSLKVD